MKRVWCCLTAKGHRSRITSNNLCKQSYQHSKTEIYPNSPPTVYLGSVSWYLQLPITQCVTLDFFHEVHGIRHQQFGLQHLRTWFYFKLDSVSGGTNCRYHLANKPFAWLFSETKAWQFINAVTLLSLTMLQSKNQYSNLQLQQLLHLVEYLESQTLLEDPAVAGQVTSQAQHS